MDFGHIANGIKTLSDLFVYGTLRDLDLLVHVLGRCSERQTAKLPGHSVFWAKDEIYPMIAATQGHDASGLLLKNLTDEDIARLDFYEGPYGYELIEVQLDVDGCVQSAQMYIPPDPGPTPDAPWVLEDWQVRYGAVKVEAAPEIMSYFDKLSAKEVAERMSVIETRAQARLNARLIETPRLLRKGFSWDDVELRGQRRPYSKFFAVDEIDVRYPQFSGECSNVLERAVFVSADAVTVLPYDPVLDHVLLIEQFRPGPYLRHDPIPWGIEAIAGRLDAFETPEQTAHREAHEEADLSLGDLHLVGRYYSSPGAKTEYLYSYIATCDLSGRAEGLGGLKTENEDIRTLVVPFDDLEAAMQQGEVENAPLLVSTLWLQRERARLRQIG